MKAMLAALLIVSAACTTQTPQPPQPPTDTGPPPAALRRPGTTVHVRVTGLCTFVDQFDEAPAGQRMPFALHLMKARDHVALIAFDERFAADPASGRVEDDRGKRLVRLNGERLVMKDAVPSPLDYSETPLSCPVENDGGGSFAAVPRLSNILGTKLSRNDLRTEFVGSSMSRDMILGLTDVSFGTLRTRNVHPIAWAFRARSGRTSPHAQFMAHEVIWTFTVPDKVLTIASAPLTGEGGGEALVRLTAPEGESEIELTLANVAQRDLARLFTTSVTEVCPVDEHFTMYYDYLASPPAPDDRPRPVARGVCDGSVESSAPSAMARHVDSLACGDRPRDPDLLFPDMLGGLNCGPDRLP